MEHGDFGRIYLVALKGSEYGYRKRTGQFAIANFPERPTSALTLSTHEARRPCVHVELHDHVVLFQLAQPPTALARIARNANYGFDIAVGVAQLKLSSIAAGGAGNHIGHPFVRIKERRWKRAV
jgi:hypothetical protein